MTTQRLKVMLAPASEGASYDIRVGTGLLEKLGEHLRALPAVAQARKAVIITDSTVGALYLSRVKTSLAEAGFEVFDLTVPAGEDTKNLLVAGELYDALGLLGIGRDDVVVALGGGMVGDLAGFVASTWLRGIACVQVPTSLLAMVDSSVGGKTAVNAAAGKNLIGTFRQPIYVAADRATLATLPQSEWDNGLAEIAKSALIEGPAFVAWLVENVAALRACDLEAAQQAVVRAASFKAGVVARDETETGLRECLNYGHTFAHALEAASDFALPHGRAVAEGIRFAARLAVEAIGAPATFAAEQEALLDALGLGALGLGELGERELKPGELGEPELEALDEDKAALSADALFERMYTDKKVRGGKLRFVLASAPGVWQTVAVDPDLVKIYLIYWEQARAAQGAEL